MAVGVAIGRNTHTVVVVNGKVEETKKSDIPNSQEGVEEVRKILQDLGENEVAFAGNRRWALPFACALVDQGVDCFYYVFKTERGKRGRTGNMANVLAKALQSGVKPKPFFREQPRKPAPEEMPGSYRVALEYLNAADRVRKLKHHLLDCLAVLFPEAVKAGKISRRTKAGMEMLPVPRPQPPGIFTKRMRLVLENPDPFQLEDEQGVPPEVREFARKSLGRYIPLELRRKTLNDHRIFLAQYDHHVALKEAKMEEVRRIAAQHPLFELFDGRDTISLLIAFLGWRTWLGKRGWRGVRRFCGLDVSCIDSKGNPRISRVRPEIRQYLFLLKKTKKGGEITNGVEGRVKQLERLLKYLWNNGLKWSPVTV